MIAMPALFLDLEYSGGRQAGQMPARGLRCNPGGPRQLRRRERTPVHQRMQHSSACRIADQRGNLRKSVIADHGEIPCLRPAR